jgi:F-type H+-transporting ATPase subunit a
MRLSPDEMIFWQRGFLKLNATIVFTWGLMLVLAVGSKVITRKLSMDLKRSRWQNLLEIVVTGIEKQIEEVGRLARSRPRWHLLCACLLPCRSSVSRSKGWAATSSPM